MQEMNGMEFVKLLRQEKCLVPVILITGYTSVVDPASAQRMGISAILQKPFGLSELRQALKPMLSACHKLASELSDEWGEPEREFRVEG